MSLDAEVLRDVLYCAYVVIRPVVGHVSLELVSCAKPGCHSHITHKATGTATHVHKQSQPIVDNNK